MSSKKEILVTIRCAVYNQERYIRQCLEGFVMQETSFCYEAIVHDDASTDETVVVIKEFANKYPHIIKPILETENQYSKQDGSLTRIFDKNTNGKYIAFCEGDDYWIDPSKLQKQVDFLESNPEYGMCYTRSNRYVQEDNRYIPAFGGPFTTFDDLLNGNCIPTLTVVARRDLINQYRTEIKPELKKWKMGDYPMWLWFAYNSKIGFIDEVTSVYRILKNSASHSPSADYRIGFALNSIDIQEYYSDLYNVEINDRSTVEWRIKLYNYALSGNFFKYMNVWWNGVNNHWQAIFDVKPYKYLLFFICPLIRHRYM